MDAYFEAKAALFTPPHARRGCVNVDDPWGRRLLEAPAIECSTFAVAFDADLQATDVRVDASGLRFVAGGLAV